MEWWTITRDFSRYRYLDPGEGGTEVCLTGYRYIVVLYGNLGIWAGLWLFGRILGFRSLLGSWYDEDLEMARMDLEGSCMSGCTRTWRRVGWMGESTRREGEIPREDQFPEAFCCTATPRSNIIVSRLVFLVPFHLSPNNNPRGNVIRHLKIGTKWWYKP